VLFVRFLCGLGKGFRDTHPCPMLEGAFYVWATQERYRQGILFVGIHFPCSNYTIRFLVFQCSVSVLFVSVGSECLCYVRGDKEETMLCFTPPSHESSNESLHT
jgi:hypothetical protein